MDNSYINYLVEARKLAEEYKKLKLTNPTLAKKYRDDIKKYIALYKKEKLEKKEQYEQDLAEIDDIEREENKKTSLNQYEQDLAEIDKFEREENEQKRLKQEQDEKELEELEELEKIDDIEREENEQKILKQEQDEQKLKEKNPNLLVSKSQPNPNPIPSIPPITKYGKKGVEIPTISKKKTRRTNNIGFTETLKKSNVKITTKQRSNRDICNNIFINGSNVNNKYFYPSEFPNITKLKPVTFTVKKGGKKRRHKMKSRKHK